VAHLGDDLFQIFAALHVYRVAWDGLLVQRALGHRGRPAASNGTMS
jgi:hypothetical protein